MPAKSKPAKKKQLRTSRITSKRIPVGKRFKSRHTRSPESKKLKPLRREKYRNLSLIVRKNPMGGEYKYLIQGYAMQGHSAFHTRKGLNRFLKITGLKVGKTKTFNNPKAMGYKLIGSYERISVAGHQKLLDEFGKKNGLRPEKILDNGTYTKGWYGKGKVYVMNPNYTRTRYAHFSE
ncbi:hypothetical protein KAT51_00875 [bacterium]|nr:hypothetical protein [bacterium]